MTSTPTTLTFGDGQYTIQSDGGGGLCCLRYGSPWRNLTGDNMVLALAMEVQELRERLKLSNDYLNAEWRANRLSSGMSDALIDNLNSPVE